MVNRKSPTPAYYQVQTELKKYIEDNHWLPGEKIPTENELSDHYSLSVGTIRQAIINLVNEGYLYRVAGKGSFVKGTKLRRGNLRYYRLLKHFDDDEELDLTVKFISLSQSSPSSNHMKYLNLRQNQKIYMLKRLFNYGYKPMITSISYLPCTLFPGLEKLPNTVFDDAPLYSILEDHYGLTTVHNKQLFGLADADQEIAKMLNLNVGSPLILIEMLSYTYQEKVYEYRESFCAFREQKILAEI